MRIDGDTVRFRNGKEEYAACGIIGISPDGTLSGGYDDGFGMDIDGSTLTKDEREELAAYMIDQWAKFGVKEVI